MLALAENALENSQWERAIELADESLISVTIPEEIIMVYLIEACAYGQMSLKHLSSNKQIPNEINSKQGVILKDNIRRRHAVAFAWKAFELAKTNCLEELKLTAIRLTWELACTLITGNFSSHEFIVPLSKMAEDMTPTNDDNGASLLIIINSTVAKTLLDIIQNFNESTNSFYANAWPSFDSLSELVQSANEIICRSLFKSLKLSITNHKYSNSLFQIMKIFIRFTKSEPSAISIKNIEELIQMDGQILSYYKLHSLPESQVSNFLLGIYHDLDNILKSSQINLDQSLFFLLDLAEIGLNLGLITIAESIICRCSILPTNTHLLVKKDLLALRIRLISISSETPVSRTKLQQSLCVQLSIMIQKSLEYHIESDTINSACLSLWNCISTYFNHEQTDNQNLWIIDCLKTLCLAAEHIRDIDKSIQCLFEYELAKKYELYSIFSLAVVHAENALQICKNSETANEIEILLQKLWIKGNKFDGNLDLEVQGKNFYQSLLAIKANFIEALSMVDQAKYMPDYHLAYKLMERALKILVPVSSIKSKFLFLVN
jgi:hypothetical protein